jgi:hypothetical protein
MTSARKRTERRANSPADVAQEVPGSRKKVEAWCQMLVNSGAARWRSDVTGRMELETSDGEIYLFELLGITRSR